MNLLPAVGIGVVPLPFSQLTSILLMGKNALLGTKGEEACKPCAGYRSPGFRLHLYIRADSPPRGG